MTQIPTTKEGSVRVRFAPSPTGAPHVGNIRTALFAWLFARHHKGVFILRIEDTDQSRSVPESLEQILSALNWLGLAIDEGVVSENKEIGERGPYHQSKRLEIYKKYAEELVADNHAYYCFCSEDRLKTLRAQQEAQKIPPKYDRHCLNLSAEEIKAKLSSNEPKVIRLRVHDSGETKFTDIIKGEVIFQNSTVDDQVLLKSDGFPTYHLASVVDDHLMDITHVIRAEEWLSSVPKHIMLYEYFGWQAPKFAHVPIILGPDKSKLSKRHGAVSVLDYRLDGYLADALVNYLALLGWNPKTNQEIFTREELIAAFDLDKVNKSNPIFDITKLNWMNGEYIKKMGVEELTGAVLSLRAYPAFDAGGAKQSYSRDKDSLSDEFPQRDCQIASVASMLPRNDIIKSVKLAQDRMEKLSDFETITEFLWKGSLEYSSELLIPKTLDQTQTKTHLQTFLGLAQGIDESDWQEEKLRKTFLDYCEKNNVKRGDFLWPARVALTGLKYSPDLFAVMDVLGKEKSKQRIEAAISLF